MNGEKEAEQDRDGPQPRATPTTVYRMKYDKHTVHVVHGSGSAKATAGIMMLMILDDAARYYSIVHAAVDLFACSPVLDLVHDREVA